MANAASTFAEVFQRMQDVYNGEYHPLLAEFQVNAQIDSAALLRQMITRLPVDRVPSLFMYQDPNTTLRIIHHIHLVEPLFGQPDNPLTNMYLGLTGEVYHGIIQVVQVPTATFFAATGDIVVPTNDTLTAQIAAAADGMVGPYNQGDPDTFVINVRKAVPIPHAYIGLVAFRSFTPREAWQQLGLQIIQDGRAQDCATLLDFLRAATVRVRAGRNLRNPPNAPLEPPGTTQPAILTPPVDGPVVEHLHRKLLQYLPGMHAPQAAHAAGEPQQQVAQVAMLVMAEHREAMRADRLQEREADREEKAAEKSFSVVFPANALGLRRLCLAGNDDELLPEFWQFFASIKGKKGPGAAALADRVSRRAAEPDSAGVPPIIATNLYVNISSFALGASDPEIITQGVSPFLMCPDGSAKAEKTAILTHEYMLLQGETVPRLDDIRQLVPSNNYHIPEDFHTLADYLGAYSVIWDVLIGPEHPLAVSLRQHHRYWISNMRSILKAIPESKLRNVVIIGTLRHIQLYALRYVSKTMLYGPGTVPVPTFDLVVDSIEGRLFHHFPSLPPAYTQPVTQTKTPVTTQTSSTPRGNKTSGEGVQIVASAADLNKQLMDTFDASDKSIQELRRIPKQPRAKGGTAHLCLSYHLKGVCFDICRKSKTHRPLDKQEVENMQAFLKLHL